MTQNRVLYRHVLFCLWFYACVLRLPYGTYAEIRQVDRKIHVQVTRTVNVIMHPRVSENVYI